MTETPISLIRAAQVPSAARVLANAFADAPRFDYLLQGDARRHAKLTWYWGAVIRACIHSGWTVQVIGGVDRSTVRAVAIWEPPHQVKHSFFTLVRSGLMAAPLRLGLPAYRRRRALGRLLAELDPPQPCWYLDTIGVEPSDQRTGLGTAMISTMLLKIDEQPLPSFLDTSAPENLGYYERFGFRVTAESRLPNGLPLWGMTRPPRSSGRLIQ